MAGLLDFSGSDPSMAAYQGMLSPDMQKMVQQRQLLGLAQGLLQGGAPSRLPVGFGQALGQGLQGMQQGQDQGIQQALQPLLLQSQLKKAGMEKLGPGETMYDVNSGKPVMSNSIFGSQNEQSGDKNAQQNNLTGDEFLKAVSPDVAGTIKGIAEGRIPVSPMMTRTPQGMQLLAAVSKYDPTFDAVNYTSRSSTRKSFTSGTDANNITALNTGMNHAASLKDAYDKLGNTDYPAINSAKNWLGNAIGDTQTQTNTAAVGAKGHALSGELAKVFRSTGMAESDIKAWENKLSTSATPAQSKEVLNSAMDLMEGRLQALTSKYNQGMGTTKSGIELLSPEAQKAYAKVKGVMPYSVTASGNQSGDSAAAESNQPNNVVSYQDYFK